MITNQTHCLKDFAGRFHRPKSVRNRCVIEVFGCVCVCCPLVFEFSVGIGGFVIGLGQISFFFSCYISLMAPCKITQYHYQAVVALEFSIPRVPPVNIEGIAIQSLQKKCQHLVLCF